MIKLKSFVITLLLLLLDSDLVSVKCANILFLLGAPGPSQHIWNRSIMLTLAERGHNITALTVEVDKSKENLHFIHIENVYEKITEQIPDLVEVTSSNPLVEITTMYNYFAFIDKIVLDTKGVQTLLNYSSDFKFDLIIHDFTQAPVLLGFVEYFNRPPLISISAFGLPSHTSMVASVPIYPSYMPHLSTSYDSKIHFIYNRYVNVLAKKYFGDDLPKLQEIGRRSDMVLVNIDFCFDQPVLLPPNVIPVGGLQVSRKDFINSVINEMMDESHNGLIYISFGTTILSAYLPTEQKTAIIELARALPQFNFLWKYEAHDLKKTPNNLLFVDWVPQASVLAHKNTKVFITQGGQLSVQEAIYNGVPMIGIPFFMEQHQNIRKVVKHGIGIKLVQENITAMNLLRGVIDITTTKSYRINAKKRSKLFKGHKEHPMDRAIYWIEYTIENKGLSHLRIEAQNMSFFRIYMLDIIGILIGMILIYGFLIKRHVHRKRSDTETPINANELTVTNSNVDNKTNKTKETKKTN